MSALQTHLLAAIRQNRAPHAILITGPAGSDMLGLARCAAALYCTGHEDSNLLINCPDYQELSGEGMGVDDIRTMQKALIPRPFAGNRAVVFPEAHRMTEAAQNALLKTLEEPPHDTMLLLAGNENGLLYTIRSRCAILRLGAMQEEALQARLIAQGYPASTARLAAQLSDGAPLLAEQMASESYQAFFKTAKEIFALILFAAPNASPPYAQMTALMNMEPLAASQNRTKTEERRESGLHCLRIWQHIALTFLHAALGLQTEAQGPMAIQSRTPSRRFTIKQIQGIIKLILSAERRIAVANPQLTMDALVTALFVPVDERKE